MGKKKDPWEGGTVSAAYRSRTGPPSHFVRVKPKDDGKDFEDVIVENGFEFEKVDRLTFDLDAMPDHVLQDLLRAVHEGVNEFYSIPENREWLEKQRKKRKEEQKASQQ